MQLRNKFGAFGAAAALALAAAGCGGDGDGDGGADADPTLQLASSAEALGEGPFKIEMNMGEMMTADGAVDPAAGSSEITMSLGDATMDMEIRVISTENDIWMNMGEMTAMLGVETEWMHLDLSRLGPEGFMGVEPGASDPGNAAEMLEAMSDVEQVDDTTFEGVIDLTESAPGSFSDEAIAQLGEDAAEVAFTASVDDQGRISTIEIDMPEMPDLPAGAMPDSLEVRYYDYGTPAEITPPPDDAVSPLPDEMYEMLEQM